MRAWLWSIVGLWLSACSGGYPLEPTPCDRYCHATKNLQCDFYGPANCVSQCESDGKGQDACRAQLNAVVACFTNTPGAVEERCSFYSYYGNQELSCNAELSALTDCTFVEQFEQ